MKNTIKNFVVPSLLVLVGIAFLGLCVSFISQYIYVYFVYPVIMGIIGRIFARKFIPKINLQKTWVKILIASVIGCLIFLSFFIFSYMWFRIHLVKEIADYIAKRPLQFNSWQVGSITDKYLNYLTGTNGFFAYLILKAKAGLSFKLLIPSYGSGIDITRLNNPFITVIFWLFELAIIVFVTTSDYVSIRPKKSFNKENRQISTIGKEVNIGFLSPKNYDILRNQLKSETSQISFELIKSYLDEPSVAIYLTQVPTTGESVMTATKFLKSESGRLLKQELGYTVISSEVRQQFLQVIENNSKI